jgi:hypothetical protein
MKTKRRLEFLRRLAQSPDGVLYRQEGGAYSSRRWRRHQQDMGYTAHRGGRWFITEKGREWIRREARFASVYCVVSVPKRVRPIAKSPVELNCTSGLAP